MAGIQEDWEGSIPCLFSSSSTTPRDLRLPLSRQLITTLAPNTTHSWPILLGTSTCCSLFASDCSWDLNSQCYFGYEAVFIFHLSLPHVCCFLLIFTGSTPSFACFLLISEKQCSFLCWSSCRTMQLVEVTLVRSWSTVPPCLLTLHNYNSLTK